MRLFLDCEFNGFKGELISMAIIAEDGREWYEVLPCENPVQWVAENVIPILNREPLKNMAELTLSLFRFLQQFETVHIVADWPEDIVYFCQTLITGPGMRIDTPPLTMEVIRIESESVIPHNALCDARGIREKIRSV